MKTYTFVSNNPKIKALALENIELFFMNDLQEVMIKVRDLIHSNYKLETHPLTGSVKPVQNPFRTIILSKGTELDFTSLEMIDNSIEKVNMFQKVHTERTYPEQILLDYQEIDFSLMNTAIQSLKIK